MSGDKPLITTVIPTYRRPALLRRAIRSALAQEAPLQVCVYDNASGDTTRDVVQGIARDDPRVKYFCQSSNIGPHANFQYAFDRIETPYFSFLSDDDVLLPGFYARAISGLIENPSAHLWAGTTVRMTDVGQVYDAHLEKWPREGLYSGMEGLKNIARGYAPVWTGMLFSTAVLETVGHLDPSVGSALDLDWLLRITARHPFVVSKEPVAILTLHANSFSESAPLSSIWPGWLRMIENVTSVETLVDDERDFLRTMLADLGKKVTFRHAAQALGKGNHGYAAAAAQVQRDFFGDPLSSRFLFRLSRLCAYSPLIQHSYTFLYNFATTIALLRRRPLQRSHGHLVHFLKITDRE